MKHPPLLLLLLLVSEGFWGLVSVVPTMASLKGWDWMLSCPSASTEVRAIEEVRICCLMLRQNAVSNTYTSAYCLDFLSCFRSSRFRPA